MSPVGRVVAEIDLAQIRRNVQGIAQRSGVPVIAVIKANAYGLGAAAVAEAIEELVEGFYVFDAAEAVAVGKRTIALLGRSDDPADYLARKIQPVVWNVERARMLKKAQPILSVDTGQGRFAASPQDIAAIVQAGDIAEAMTHATSENQVELFRQIMIPWIGKVRLHAAGSSLLENPAARFSAVRPGFALYQNAVRVSTPLRDVKDSTGPAGYTQFRVERFGVILAGYSSGLRPGPCAINGQPRRILEVGMQSSFVEIGQAEKAGDEVVLLGDGVEPEMIAAAWSTSRQEALLRLTTAAEHRYRR